MPRSTRRSGKVGYRHAVAAPTVGGRSALATWPATFALAISRRVTRWDCARRKAYRVLSAGASPRPRAAWRCPVLDGRREPPRQLGLTMANMARARIPSRNQLL
jgi:hypothetical protein